MLLLYILRKLA